MVGAERGSAAPRSASPRFAIGINNGPHVFKLVVAFGSLVAITLTVSAVSYASLHSIKDRIAWTRGSAAPRSASPRFAIGINNGPHVFLALFEIV
jgi:hypothetical protein